jgi:hypothetical protein
LNYFEDGQRKLSEDIIVQLSDLASGKSSVLAIVKDKARGELLPPNQIVYRDAFEGSVRADLVPVSQHNFSSHDLILRSRPRLPEGMSPDSTVLEIDIPIGG